MATDFKYLPLDPEPISGPQMLRQTEIAINEISGLIDTDLNEIRQIAENAQRTADEALAEAVNASNTANVAISIANGAEQKAQEAIDLANSFDGRITTAQNRSDEAYDLAANASSTANNALNIANTNTTQITNINTEINSIQDAISDLEFRVENIQLQNSQEFIVNEDETDLDDLYSETWKYYFTGTVLNAPDLSGNLYFKNEISSDITSCVQTIFNEESPNEIYTRIGSITADKYSSSTAPFVFSSNGTTEISSDITVSFSTSGQEFTSSSSDITITTQENDKISFFQTWTITGNNLPYSIEFNGVEVAQIDSDGNVSLLVLDVPVDNGSLGFNDISYESGIITINSFFTFNDVFNVGFIGWLPIGSGGGGGGSEQSKDDILGAITINNVNTDINQAIGINGRYYIQNAAISNLPVAERGVIEIVSDTAKTNTFMQFISETHNLYYRNSTSEVTLTPGSQFYTFKATSGTTEIYQYFVLRYTETGGLVFVLQGGGSGFTIEEQESNGLAITGKMDFYTDNTIFRENGFTLEIINVVGGADQPDPVTVEFPAYGAGDPVVTTDTVTGSSSYIRYQSGEQLNAGGSEAKIYFSAAWTDYTGAIEWTTWNQPNNVVLTHDLGISDELTITNSENNYQTIRIQPDGNLTLNIDPLSISIEKLTTIIINPSVNINITYASSGDILWESDELTSIDAGASSILNIWQINGVTILRNSVTYS